MINESRNTVVAAAEQSVRHLERGLNTPLASFPFDLQSRLIDATSVQDV